MITRPGRTADGRRDGTPDPGALWTLVESSMVTTAVGPTGPIAAFPCSEYEVLAALRERLGHVRVRPAGSTCLLEGVLP